MFVAILVTLRQKHFKMSQHGLHGLVPVACSIANLWALVGICVGTAGAQFARLFILHLGWCINRYLGKSGESKVVDTRIYQQP